MGRHAGWPLIALDDRIGRLFDCHHLAIALADVTWLRRLHEAWSVAPRDVDELRVLRATGEIGLGLGADGDRPHGWSAEEIHDRVAEGFLLPHAPSERAWLALARGDLVEARTAVEDAGRARALARDRRPAAGVPGMVWTWSLARSGPCRGSRRDEDVRGSRGGVAASWLAPDVIDDHEIGSQDPGDRLAEAVVGL